MTHLQGFKAEPNVSRPEQSSGGFLGNAWKTMKGSLVACLKAIQDPEEPSSIAVTTTKSTIKQAGTDEPWVTLKLSKSTRARIFLEVEEVSAGILCHAQNENDIAKSLTRSLIDLYNIPKSPEETLTHFDRDVPSRAPPAVVCSGHKDNGQMSYCRPDEGTLDAAGPLSKATYQSYSSLLKQSNVGRTNAHKNRTPPVRQSSMQRSGHATAPLLSLLLLSLVLTGVDAASIPDHRGPHLTASLSWPSNTTESLVLISSVVLFLCIAKRFLKGSGQQGHPVVPIWTILTSVLPLSLFVFADLDNAR